MTNIQKVNNSSTLPSQETNKPKIAYFLDSLVKIAGTERIYIDKANYMAEILGYDITIITLSQKGNDSIFPISNKVKRIDLGINYFEIYNLRGPKRFFGRLKKEYLLHKKIEDIVRKYKYNILDTPSLQIASALLHVKTKAKRIFESHIVKSHLGTNDGTKRTWLKNLAHTVERDFQIKRICKYFDCVVVLTKEDLKQWGKAKRVELIPNMTYFYGQSVNNKHKRNICVTMGRLVYQKNHNILIQAWKFVHKQHPDWKLKIYGEGPEYNNLLRTIQQLGLEDCISIYPPNGNITDILGEAKIFTLTSLYEGFGLVLIEAMSLGIPCVSTDCPAGPSEIIETGINGILVQNNNAKLIAESILSLIDDDDLISKMGQKAKESVVKYSPERIIIKWEKLFNNLTRP